MPTIAERIRKIIVDQLGADPAAVVDDASFADDLGPSATPSASSKKARLDGEAPEAGLIRR